MKPYLLFATKYENFDRVMVVLAKLLNYHIPTKFQRHIGADTITVIVMVESDEEYQAVQNQLTLEVPGFREL